MRDGGGAREIGRREGVREGEQVRKRKREGKGRGSRSNISLGVEQPYKRSACSQMQPSRGGKRSRFAYPFCLILVTYCSGFIYSPCD